jgi:ankyrin repeat protein
VQAPAWWHISEAPFVSHLIHELFWITQVLLAAGAHVEPVDKELGFNALLFSSSQGNTSVVSELVAAGAAVSYANQSGISALLLAARSGFLPVVQTLVQAGANVDQVRGAYEAGIVVSSSDGAQGSCRWRLAVGH